MNLRSRRKRPLTTLAALLATSATLAACNGCDPRITATFSRRSAAGGSTWPALVDGGTIYVGSMDGRVYAIRSDATGLLPGAGSPRFHGGNDSTGRHE